MTYMVIAGHANYTRAKSAQPGEPVFFREIRDGRWHKGSGEGNWVKVQHDRLALPGFWSNIANGGDC
jgi:phosphoribosyl-AMP cyclohydrolase